MPRHHALAADIDAGIVEDRKGWLLRTAPGVLSDQSMISRMRGG